MPKPKDDVAVDYLRSALAYDQTSGVLTWIYRRDMTPQWNARYAGKSAGTLSNGYLSVSIQGRLYRAHRVAWALMTGSWPEGEIDHRNRVRSDNAWRNLREASRVENSRNVASTGRNKSGFKGVSFDKGMRRWVARMKVGTKYAVLGYGDTPEAASALYVEAARRSHCDFFATGREA